MWCNCGVLIDRKLYIYIYLVCFFCVFGWFRIWELSRCRSPTKKLDCLVNLKDVIIQCIDEHRDLFDIIESDVPSEIEETDSENDKQNDDNNNNNNNNNGKNENVNPKIVSEMNSKLFNNDKSNNNNDDMDIVSVLSSKLSNAQFSSINSINGKRDLSKIDEKSQNNTVHGSNPVLSTLALGFHSDSKNKNKNSKNTNNKGKIVKSKGKCKGKEKRKSSSDILNNLNSSMPIRTHGIVDINDDTNMSLISVASEVSEYWTQTINDRTSITSMMTTLTPRTQNKVKLAKKSGNKRNKNDNKENSNKNIISPTIGDTRNITNASNTTNTRTAQSSNIDNRFAPLTKQNVLKQNERNEFSSLSLSEKKRKKNKSKYSKYNIGKQNTKKRKKEVLIGSDDMLPLFCYAFVQSQLPCLHAEIAFMSDFMSEEDKQMKPGFCLATLQAAVAALIAGKLPVFTN